MVSKDLRFVGNFTGSYDGADYDVSYQCSHDIDSTYEDDIRDYVEEKISDGDDSGYESFEMSTGFYDGEIEIEGTVTWESTMNAEVEMIECGNCDKTFTIDEGLDIGGIDYCEECYDTRSSKDAEGHRTPQQPVNTVDWKPSEGIHDKLRKFRPGKMIGESTPMAVKVIPKNAETFEAMGWHDPRWAGDREAVEAKFKAMYPTYTIEEDSMDYLVYSGGASNKYHVFFLATDPAGNYHSFNAYGRIGYTPTLHHNAGPGTKGSVTQAISKKRYQKSKKGYVQQAETFEATTGYGYDDPPERMTDEEGWLELHERYEDDEEWGQMTLEEFKKAFIEQTEKDDEIQRKYEQRLKDEGRDMDGNPIKSAETFEADFDYYYSSYDKERGMEILDRLRTMNPETKAEALDWLIDNGFLHSEEVYNSAYINAMGDALYITSEEDYDAEAGSFRDGTGCISKGSFPSLTCEHCGFNPHDLVYYQCKQNDEDLTWDEWQQELEFYFYEGSHSEQCQGLIDEMDAEESFAQHVLDKVLSEKDYEKVELAKPIRTGWGLGAGIALFSVTATLAAVSLSNLLGKNNGDE